MGKNTGFLEFDRCMNPSIEPAERIRNFEEFHPYLNEKMSWGLIPYVQALLLARYIRGDLDAYPPFLWK